MQTNKNLSSCGITDYLKEGEFMIRPILSCSNPYEISDIFVNAGWNLDFSQPIESGDPLVGVSLYGNSILLGVVEGYVKEEDVKHLGCGVEIYLTVPHEHIETIYQNHKNLEPTELKIQSWGDYAFEVIIGGYKFMIASN